MRRERAALMTVDVRLCVHRHATLTRFLPSVFGFGGVGPGAGGGDVRIWDGAILHPQGVPALSWRAGGWGGKQRQRRGG